MEAYADGADGSSRPFGLWDLPVAMERRIGCTGLGYRSCRDDDSSRFITPSLPKRMEYTEFESFIEQSTDYLRSANERNKRLFGIGDYARYEYDLFRNEIWWSDVEDPKVRARVTIVGSISTKSDTWLWSWANPHFKDVEIGPIRAVRDFGGREGIAKLTDEKWSADEVDGWEMTSVSARLLEAQGAYRSPSANGGLFLLYDGLEFIPEDEKQDYRPLKRKAEQDAP